MSLGPPTPEKQTRRAARTRLLMFAGGKSSDLLLLTEILSAILRGDVNGFHWGQPRFYQQLYFASGSAKTRYAHRRENSCHVLRHR